MMKSGRFVIACVLLGTAFAQAQEYLISTYAGGAPLPAPAADWDVSITADAVGNQYFAGYYTVFKRDLNGIVTRIAGISRPGFSGDGGPAIDAELNRPWNIAVDGLGNVFIADLNNYRIRKVSPDGIITTVAGNGKGTFSGEGGPATAAGMTPVAIAVDNTGNLFIAHAPNGISLNDGSYRGDANRVVRVSLDGIITTVAGGGNDQHGDGGPATAAALGTPYRLAVDASGTLYIAEPYNGRVRKVSTDGIITTVAGSRTYAPGTWGETCAAGSGNGVSAVSAKLCLPFSVAVDSTGNLFIGEFGYRCCYDIEDVIIADFAVRQVSPGGIIGTVAGSHTSGLLCNLAEGPIYCADVGNASVSVDSGGDLFFSDSLRSIEISATGNVTTLLDDHSAHFAGDGEIAIRAQLWWPSAVAVDGAGNLFIGELNNSRVRKVSRDGVISTVAGNGSVGYSGDGGLAIHAQLNGVTGIAVDGAGNLFIAERFNKRIRKVSPDGIITTVAGGGGDPLLNGGPGTSAQLGYLTGVTVDAQGNVFFADATGVTNVPYNRIRKLSPDGTLTTIAGGGTNLILDGGPATSAELFNPGALAVDGSGNLFVADGPKIRKVSPDGIIRTVAGGGTDFPGDGGLAINALLTYVPSVAVDSIGNLFIGDGSRLRRVSPDGIITTIGGNGTYGYSGDRGPATRAELSANAVAVDDAGNVYVADSSDNLIRVLRHQRRFVPPRH